MSVDTLNADLATLRDYLAAPASAVTRTEGRAALDRVEAELARLTARRSRYAEARYENCMEALSAAEAELSRLREERDAAYEAEAVAITQRDELQREIRVLRLSGDDRA